MLKIIILRHVKIRIKQQNIQIITIKIFQWRHETRFRAYIRLRHIIIILSKHVNNIIISSIERILRHFITLTSFNIWLSINLMETILSIKRDNIWLKSTIETIDLITIICNWTCFKYFRSNIWRWINNIWWINKITY